MQQTTTQLTWQHGITGLFLVLWLTFVGGLPISFIAALLFGGAVGQDIGLLTGILVAVWFPAKLLVDRTVKSTNLSSIVRFLPRLSLPAIMLTSVVSLVLLPVLWILVAPAFIAGSLAYALLGQSLPAGLLAGLVVQIGSIYRSSVIEKARGVNSSFFVQMESMQNSFNVDTISLNDNKVVIEESITNDYPTDYQDDDNNTEPPMTIVQTPRKSSDAD